jgi:hypothetical protein
MGRTRIQRGHAVNKLPFFIDAFTPRRVFEWQRRGRVVFLSDSAVAALDSCQTDPYTKYDFEKTRFRKIWAGHGSNVATQ